MKLESLRTFYNFKFREMFNLIYETKWKISTKEIIQILFTIYTKLFGIVVFIAFLISFLLASYRMIQKRLNFLK